MHPGVEFGPEWPSFLIKERREIAFCVCTHIAAIAPQAVVSVGNCGNLQLALAWDDSLVTPLRSLGRPEDVGTRSPVLGFC